MMISCKEASKLTSKKIDRSLSFKEKMMWRLHMMMCKVCALFYTEADLIAKVLEDKLNNTPKLSETSKERMLKSLESEMK